MTTSIVFIDTHVADYQTLIDGLEPNAEFYLIDSQSDGLEQIASHLQGRSGIDAIHIISHGSSGSVSLGSSVIDSAALDTHAGQLAVIGQSLTETADILLYGCNVGAGETGLQFIGSLAQATGADVAASTDLTGAAALGGNWILEAATGAIEIPVALDTSKLDNYQSALITTYSLSPATTSVSEGVGTVTFTVTRSGTLPAETVYVSTSTGEGYTNSSDYTGKLNEALTFTSGLTSKTVTVSITNDTVVENNETFGLLVQRNSTDAASIYLAKTTFTIQDNDTVATSY